MRIEPSTPRFTIQQTATGVTVSAPARRNWLDRGIEEKARDLFGVPTATIYGTPAASRPTLRVAA